MKKLLSAAAALTLTYSGAQADMLRVWAGVGGWSASPSGEIRGDNSGDTTFDLEDDGGMESSGSFYGWFMVKHFVPLLPNLRVERTSLSFDGKSERGLTVDGKTFGVNADTELTLDQTDVILYYNFLDNLAWLTLDLGFGAKLIDGEISAKSFGQSASVEIDAPVPVLYGRVRAEVPTTGLAFEADTKSVSVGDFSLSDTRLKIDYDLLSAAMLSLGVEGGYRIQTLDFDSGKSDPYADVDISGVFFGANLKF